MAKSTSPSSFEVPDHLIAQIRAGRCVAFVGAGFSQPSRPSWRELLRRLARRIDDDPPRRDELLGWLERPELGHRDYEAIGAAVQAHLGASFRSALRGALGHEINAPNDERLRLLRRIPFHAILTTNFDDLLTVSTPCGPTAFASVLQSDPKPWWDRSRWTEPETWKVPVVKLHGTIGDEVDDEVVFTTRAYRDRVHGTVGYQAFLRALFATHTVLYMGFSFTDAYINQLRSETLALLGADAHRRKDYAILDDVPELMQSHLAEHEGLIPLTFGTGPERRDYSGFDAWLKAIHDRTSPHHTLHEVLRDRRILWFDPRPKNNEYGHAALRESMGEERLHIISDLDEAVHRLQANREPDRSSEADGYDLVISHFGYREGAPSNLERLVRALRAHELWAPVVVFSDGQHRAENRALALRLGALAFTDNWAELFRTLHDVFVDPTHR